MFKTAQFGMLPTMLGSRLRHTVCVTMYIKMRVFYIMYIQLYTCSYIHITMYLWWFLLRVVRCLPKILGTSYMGYFQDDMAEKEPGWAGPLQ